MLLEELRKKALLTARKLRLYELVSLAGGTVCARDQDSGLVVITASGMDYDDMEAEDVCVVDMAMNLVDGSRKPSVATDMFLEILKARPDVGAVIHTHSRWATAFACLDREIPVVTTTQANLVGGPVPVVRPLHPGPHTHEYLANIVRTLGQGKAVNLMSHGPVVAGSDLDDCFSVAVTIEDTAAVCAAASIMGKPLALNEQDTQIAYEYCQRAVGQGKSAK